MAASGQPQDISNDQKQTAPDKRKLFIGLGIAGALALVAGVTVLPGLLSGEKSATAPAPVVQPTPLSSGVASTVSATGGTAPPASSAGIGTPATSTPASAAPQPLARFRKDPFQQAYFLPTPVPTPPPLPTPDPPVSIPLASDEPPLSLPGVNGSNAALQQTLVLPPVSIKRLDQATQRPTDAFPPTRTLGGVGGSGAGVPSPSYDKRLSGVVIADGVRAILEIQGPTGPVSRVVQPGDEVDGITILNIQRFNDGTRTVTRMLIRENGEERTVELRAGAAQTTNGAENSRGFRSP